MALAGGDDDILYTFKYTKRLNECSQQTNVRRQQDTKTIQILIQIVSNI